MSLKKTAVRQPRTDVARVADEKRLVRLADLAEPVAYLQIERRGIDADLLRGQLRIAANPFIDLVVNLVVELKQFAELALNHRTGRVRRLGLPGHHLAKREQQRCKKKCSEWITPAGMISVDGFKFQVFSFE